MEERLAKEIEELAFAFFRMNFIQPSISLKDVLTELEKQVIGGALNLAGGRQRYAARLLDMRESTLCEKIKKLELMEISNDFRYLESFPVPSFLVPERKDESNSN